MFEHIRNWKLLRGTHQFPGPDGGTCINEAAIVAAGFPYRSIRSVKDCPPCFSPVISSFLISLNDAMPDDLRQEMLMPFVLRLAGTYDYMDQAKAAALEQRRAEVIATRVVKQVLPLMLGTLGLGYEAIICESSPPHDFQASLKEVFNKLRLANQSKIHRPAPLFLNHYQAVAVAKMQVQVPVLSPSPITESYVGLMGTRESAYDKATTAVNYALLTVKTCSMSDQLAASMNGASALIHAVGAVNLKEHVQHCKAEYGLWKLGVSMVDDMLALGCSDSQPLIDEKVALERMNNAVKPVIEPVN